MYKTEKPIVLVGLMGSGKSSVGRRLAEVLACPFQDLDDEIVLASGMTISEIFEQYGEEEFRALEARVLARLLDDPEPRVIATGGGAFMAEANRAAIRERAVSVWLDAALETLWARVKGKTGRPLLQNDNPKGVLAALLESRNPFYALADHRVESHLKQSHEQMVEKIVKKLGLGAKSD